MSKSGESNAFIKEDAEASLLAVVKHVSSVKAMGAFISGGAGYVPFAEVIVLLGGPKKLHELDHNYWVSQKRSCVRKAIPPLSI